MDGGSLFSEPRYGTARDSDSETSDRSISPPPAAAASQRDVTAQQRTQQAQQLQYGQTKGNLGHGHVFSKKRKKKVLNLYFDL